MLRYKRYLNEDVEIPRSTKHYRQGLQEEELGLDVVEENALEVSL
jgi:hypothetical protein